ncbi:MAG: hypothetical protein U1E62_17750 [Alsobacter sp.]
MPTVLRPPGGLDPTRDDDAGEEHARRMTVNLSVMILCLVLLGAGLFLVDGLHRAARVQACVEAGRSICPLKGPPALALPGGP